MKRITKIFAFLIVCFFLNNSVMAQKAAKIPKWLPENGNWMVETSINKPLTSVIYFYTNEGQIIYKETIEGRKLKLNKTSVKMRLKKVLDAALVAWEKNKQLAEEQHWVMNELD